MTIRLNKPNGFIGCDALATLKAQGLKRKLVGIQMMDRGIARHGYPLMSADGSTAIGHVTSGTRSPSTEQAVAMGYVDLPHHKIGTDLMVDIRGRMIAAKVVKTPFYQRPES